MYKVIWIFIFSFFIVTACYCQTNVCDSIYDTSDEPPVYAKDDVELFKYILMEITPIVEECIRRDSIVISSLYIILTIDKNGSVIDATFPRPKMTSICKENLKDKLLTMGGWNAGKINGEPACFYYNIPISCFNLK